MPIVMITGEGSEVVAAKALQKGAYEYIPKHLIDKYSINRAIDSALARANLKRKMAVQEADLKDFASMLAHDLRAPVRHINGFMEFIEKDIQEQKYDKIGEHFSYVRTATSKMNALIDTLYEYTKIDGEAVFSMIPLEKVMKNTVDTLRGEIQEKSAKVSYENLPLVYGNGVLLMQLFQNLISNALKYNESATPTIDISAEKHGEDWLVRVKDNGIGIDQEYRQKVFMPFQRLFTEKQYSGTGLGLATCKKIVDRHGGKIWCESKENEGATFLLTLAPEEVNLL